MGPNSQFVDLISEQLIECRIFAPDRHLYRHGVFHRLIQAVFLTTDQPAET